MIVGFALASDKNWEIYQDQWNHFLRSLLATPSLGFASAEIHGRVEIEQVALIGLPMSCWHIPGR